MILTKSVVITLLYPVIAKVLSKLVNLSYKLERANIDVNTYLTSKTLSAGMTIRRVSSHFTIANRSQLHNGLEGFTEIVYSLTPNKTKLIHLQNCL